MFRAQIKAGGNAKDQRQRVGEWLDALLIFLQMVEQEDVARRRREEELEQHYKRCEFRCAHRRRATILHQKVRIEIPRATVRTSMM